MPPVRSRDALYFDGFVILPAERLLLVNGAPTKIGARAFDLLMVLVESRDRVVGKGELLERVWPGMVVEENNLSVHVSRLRKLCGSKSLATIPGRGYRFVASSAHAHGPSRMASGESAETEPGVVSARRGDLPLQMPLLIGREAELDEVREMLRDHRWVTVTGAGGVGKTRLAEAVGKEIAVHFPAWIVELASVSNPCLVSNAVAQTLGATIVDTERPLDTIAATLDGQAALLILDCCEHLIGAVSELCGQLLRKLPFLRVLVTSQELLRNPEEVVYKLGPLTLPDPKDMESAGEAGAMRLLKTRVQARERHFDITLDNMNDAAVICQQLDGLPLAIELAAGRVPMLGLAGVRNLLGELFRLLAGNSHACLSRHQTLRASLDWSYQLLLPNEQALLRRLGVFSGTFSIDALRQVASDLHAAELGALDTLGALIDKSMVQVKGLDRPRYMLLETMRAYALEQLADLDETEDAQARHARATRYVCSLARHRRDREALWSEIANIRTAFAWAMRHVDAELAVSLVIDSSPVLALGGLFSEVLQRLVEVGPLVNDRLPLPLAAQYWRWLGRFGGGGRLPTHVCVAALQKAERLFRELADDRGVHACLRTRAESHLDQGDLAAAARAIESARELESKCRPLVDSMRRLRIEAKILQGRGETHEALSGLQEALDMARLVGDHRYELLLSQDIGLCLLIAGDAVGAEQRFRAVVKDSQAGICATVATGLAGIGLAVALIMQGRLAAAHSATLDAIPQLRLCDMLLPNCEVFAWLMAAFDCAHCAAILLRTADAFRARSGTARSHVHASAYDAVHGLLGEHAPSCAEEVGSNAEIAQMLSSALTVRTQFG